MKKTESIIEDGFTINWVQGSRLRHIYGVGSCFSLVTQCTISKHGLIIGLGDVVRHFRDEDDFEVAKFESFKKAVKGMTWKSNRTKLFKRIIS